MLFGSVEKYQHIERLGHRAVQGILDGDVVVQEKIDGANLTVAYKGDDLVVGSRSKAVGSDKTNCTGFRGAVEYCLMHDGIREAAKAWILRGEWLVRHSIVYPVEAMDKFYVFDCQTYDGGYVSPDAYAPHLSRFGVLMVPEVYRGADVSAEKVSELAVGNSLLAPACPREGVVVKRYGWTNEFGGVVWAKVVSADFREKNSLHFQPTKRDGDELHVASRYVTQDLVLKTIHKVEDQRGEVSVRNMAEILDRVYYDIVREELWDAVKKGDVTINFAQLRRLVYSKARDIALAFFNGVL